MNELSRKNYFHAFLTLAGEGEGKMAIKREGLPIILLVGRKLLKIFKYYFSE